MKEIFLKTANIERSGYIWNTTQSTLIAFQSAILLMVITRTSGLEDAGVFSIAYAVASLIYYVAEFGVRKYQITDVTEQCSFPDYYTHRLVTCLIAAVASFAYAGKGVLNGQYSGTKFAVIILVCGIKILEAYCDVFFARFQQKKRLDVAAKASTYRIVVPMLLCIAVLVIRKNLLEACIVWLATTVITVLTSFVPLSSEFGGIRVKFEKDKFTKISRDCLPLFSGSFLLLYAGNAPKYAIDAVMDDKAQACYNFIFMPVFAIGLLANFIFNPILVRLAEEWTGGNIKAFKKIVLRQICVIAGITALAVAVALTIGCPVLGILFNADLAGYELSLTLLMIGGGMLALANLFIVAIIVTRGQKYLIIGYAVAAVGALLFSKYIVKSYGIIGASMLYMCLLTITAAIFAIVLIIRVKRGNELD